MKRAHIRLGAEQSVETHLQNVASLCNVYCSKIGLESLGELTGWLHDIGKLTEEFNEYIGKSFNSGKKINKTIDHSTSGAIWIISKLSRNSTKLEQLTAQIIATVVMSHHGGLVDIYNDMCESPYTKRLDKLKNDNEFKKQYLQVENELLKIVSEKFLLDLFRQATGEVGKIVIKINDFYNSSGENRQKENTQIRRYMLGMLCKYVYSALIDADRYDTATFMDASDIKFPEDRNYIWKELSDRLEHNLKQYSANTEINSLRKIISDTCLKNSKLESGVYTLNCPTGSGKTMASLRFAINHAKKFNKQSIFYIVPFITITEQNTAEIKKILSKTYKDDWIENIILEIHSAKEIDKEEQFENELVAERMDAPMVFTTMVRFLNMVFSNGTRNIRSLHRLANSIIIFDEIQTIPPKCIAMFNGVINFLNKICNTTIVLATATQPVLDDTPINIPSIVLQDDSELSGCTEEMYKKFKRTEIIDNTLISVTKEDISALTCETLELEGNVLVILNTKDAVKELYHEIKRTIDSKDYKDVEIVVLTTNLYANDRKRKIAQIREYLKNKKIIVISTQLIEAGVDISFKVVIRSLAGLDSIIQASGRCNRHAEMGESYGRVYLVNPEFENLDKLPDIKQGKDIMQSLLIMYRSHPMEFGGDITNQKVIRKYFERYNEHQRGKMLYPFKTRTGVNHNIYDLLADNSQNACSVKNTIGIEYIQEMRQSYKLAGEYFRPIEEHGTPVVVSHAESTELISEVLSNTNYENKTIYLRKLQLYTVNISISLFKELGDAISYKEDLGIYILKEGYYNETLGVTSQKQDTVFYFY